MATSPSELLDIFRSDMDDTHDADEDASLWSEDEVYSYMNEAQREFFRRTDYFPAVDTGIVVTADDPLVAIPLEAYTQIRKVRLETDGRGVRLRNYVEVNGSDLEDDYGVTFISGHWEDLTGTPSIIITDLVKDKGRLVPIPTANDTLEITGFKFPTNIITCNSTAFEITEEHYIRKLVYWMRKLAYEKHDSQTFNAALSKDFEDKFDSFILDAMSTIKKATRRVGNTRYGGY